MFSMLDPAPDNEQRGPGFKNWMPHWIVFLQRLLSSTNFNSLKTTKFVFSTQKSAKCNFDLQIKVSFLHSSSLIIFYLLVLTHKW